MSENKKLVWVDTDPAYGDDLGDCDDGYAMIALFHSKHIEVVGVSAVFGNTYVANAYQKLIKLMSLEPKAPPIYWGAQEPLQLNVHTKLAPNVNLIETDASKGLATYLKNLEPGKKLTIVAIGALTNVATVLLLHPELAEKIESVIVIAGRYSVDQQFYFGTKQLCDDTKAPFRDLNFDVDPESFRALLQSTVKVVLVGVEVARKLWISKNDLNNFEEHGSPDVAYMASVSDQWLGLWRSFGNEIDDNLKPILNDEGEQIPVNGFNPFDLLAGAYAINPDWFVAEERAIEIPLAQDDTQLNTKTSFKYYLVAPPESTKEKRVIYLKDVENEFDEEIKALLMKPE
ncbi:MAG: nucleoside hydrolase [Crocinitomicaceae bacterium]|nr:nucleoside hydrolase [Crocinitomicaceae bacterium]